MARIRSIKPELRTSLVVADWPREVRYAWVLLWGYLDDHGRGVDDLRLIASDLFPLDRDVTERKIGAWLNRMTTPREDNKAGPLCRYEVAGRKFLHSVNWSEHQRVAHPGASKWPPCPLHEPDAYDAWVERGIPAGQGPTDARTDPKRSGSPPEGLGNDSRAIHERFMPSRTPARAPAEQGAGSREQGKEQGAGNARRATTRTAFGQNPEDDTPTSDPHLVAELGGFDPAKLAAQGMDWTT